MENPNCVINHKVHRSYVRRSSLNNSEVNQHMVVSLCTTVVSLSLSHHFSASKIAVNRIIESSEKLHLPL